VFTVGALRLLQGHKAYVSALRDFFVIDISTTSYHDQDLHSASHSNSLGRTSYDATLSSGLARSFETLHGPFNDLRPSPQRLRNHTMTNKEISMQPLRIDAITTHVQQSCVEIHNHPQHSALSKSTFQESPYRTFLSYHALPFRSHGVPTCHCAKKEPLLIHSSIQHLAVSLFIW
jgi:hypothetical protein